MTIVFFGTPEYVLPILESVHREFKDKKTGESPFVAVVTQEPKPAGRNKYLTYSAVDKWAHSKKMEILYSPQELVDKGITADLGICASYGAFIKNEILNLFRYGVLNIHPSLLPKYRGASPIQTAIKNGDKTTGVTIIKMDEKMDHGPIVAQFEEEIGLHDTTEMLKFRLFERSAQVLVDLIPPYIAGKIKLKEQDEALASFTNMLTKQDGYVDFKDLINPDKARMVYNLTKAMDVWPGTWTIVNGKRVKILKVKSEDEKLEIETVQLEGKNPVSWKQFENAYLKETN